MKNKEISLLMSHGRAYNSGSFLLKSFNISHISSTSLKKEVLELKKGKRIAYLASKKAFNTAVLRNKAKRRLKNGLLGASLVIKDEGSELGKNFKVFLEANILIISAKKSILTIDFKDLKEEFIVALRKVL